MAEGYEPDSFETTWLDFEQRYMIAVADFGYDPLYLEPLADIYLESEVTSAITPSANIFSLYAFGALGILIFIIACINYVNLETSRSLKRINEVAVRKIVGAKKSQLIMQFLRESLLFSLIAILLGLMLAEFILALDYVRSLIGRDLALTTLTVSTLLKIILAGSFLLGLIVGLYPAYSAVNKSILDGLRGDHKIGLQGFIGRNGLVVLQFTISIAIIASTLVMLNQMQYVQNRPPGFTKENQLNIPLWGADAIGNAAAVFEEFERSGNIVDFSIIADRSQPGSNNLDVLPVGISGVLIDDFQEFNRLYVDENFFELLDIELVQGRNFDIAFGTDVDNAVLINETAVQEMGWEDPIGKSIIILFDEATIIGVFKDYYVRGYHQKLEPTVVSYNSRDFRELSDVQRKSQSRIAIVKISSDSVDETIAFLNSNWRAIDPVHPFEYELMEEQINQLYFSEQRQLELFGIFSGVSIFISSLGLVGLASLTTQYRTKEISIRKILGASTLEVLLMLFKSTAFLLVVAALIATVVSYWFSSYWLEQFYYRTEISPLVFVLATFITVMIAFITVSSQTYKTAIANPTKTLRFE